MSDVLPKFWVQLLERLGLDSLEGIEPIKDILNFMGYSTLQAISKLKKEKEFLAFQIEIGKLHTNAKFCEKHPNLKDWQLELGTIQVIKDIAAAASMTTSFSAADSQMVQNTVFERCQKLANNLQLSDVLVNLDGKPTCEIMCPFQSCYETKKLSLSKQSNLLAPPKFNSFNFERHIKEQHLNKKRKAQTSLDLCTPLKQGPRQTQYLTPIDHRHHTKSNVVPSTRTENTPKTIRLIQLESELERAGKKIKALEKTNSATVESSSNLNVDVDTMTPKTVRILKLENDVIELKNENLVLHQMNLGKGKFQTFCRIKPETAKDCFAWQRSEDGTRLKLSDKEFKFGHIFKPNASNTDVFDMLSPLVTSAMNGDNVCVIAYGASGSGKSYTMEGVNTDLGVVPKSVAFLLEKMDDQHKLKASFFQIYNEKLIDLLKDSKDGNEKSIGISAIPSSSGDKFERVYNGVEVEIQSFQQFRDILSEANKRRNVSATERNPTSSRSHGVVQITLEKTRAMLSIITFLDLAGSENSNDHISGGEIDQRNTEMKNINTSLLCFRNVIESLQKKQAVADFRSSKLTHLLRPYFTQKSKSAIITTMSQETKYLFSSKASLEVGQSAAAIK